MLKNKKSLLLIILLLVIIISGIVMLCTKGVNYGLTYGENTNIEIYLENDFQVSDVENTVKEVFGKNKIRIVNNLEHDILITVKSASDEQINVLLSKINEKYNQELTREDIIVINNGSVDIYDIIKPYIVPLTIITLIMLVYFIIRYKKIEVVKVLVCTLCAVLGTELMYISLYTLLRLPVNQLTMPISIILFILSTIALIEIYERILEKNLEEQK